MELLPAQLRYEIIEDISHRGDKQSVIARKQRYAIEALKNHTNQGKRTDLEGKETCTSNRVQVRTRLSRRANLTEKVAHLYGEGEAAVRQRIYVLEAAESDSEKWGRFVKEMDDAGNCHGAYQRLREAQRRESTRQDAIFVDLFRQCARSIDKILKGTKPGEIPIYLPTKFELVINLGAAKALGLTVPPSVLSLADEVIE